MAKRKLIGCSSICSSGIDNLLEQTGYLMCIWANFFLYLQAALCCNWRRLLNDAVLYSVMFLNREWCNIFSLELSLPTHLYCEVTAKIWLCFGSIIMKTIACTFDESVLWQTSLMLSKVAISFYFPFYSQNFVSLESILSALQEYFVC